MSEHVARRFAVEPQAYSGARQHGDRAGVGWHPLLERAARALFQGYDPVLIGADPVQTMETALRHLAVRVGECRAGNRPDERRHRARAAAKDAELHDMPVANLGETQRTPAIGAVATSQSQTSRERRATLKHASAPRPDRQTQAARHAPARSHPST